MVKSPARLSSWPAMVPGVAIATGTVPLPRWDRSNIKVVLATRQPFEMPPMIASSGRGRR
jgi:hypothetical protein